MGKDPNAPTRPLSAFFRYAATQRDELLKTMSVSDAGKVMGQRWKKVSATQKAKFQKEYEKEKVVYDKALAKYKTTDDFADYQKVKKERRVKKILLAAKKDPARPKKPASAYFLYANDVRDEVSSDTDGSIGNVAKVVGKMWRQLSASEKKKYQDKARVLSVKYQKKRDAYQKTASYIAHKKAVDKVTGAEKKRKQAEKEKAQKARKRAADKKKREAEKVKAANARKRAATRKKAQAAKKKAAAARKKAAAKKAATKKKVALAKKKAAAAKKKSAAAKKKAKKASKKAKKASKKSKSKTKKTRKPSKKVAKKKSAARRSKKRVVKRRK